MKPGLTQDQVQQGNPSVMVPKIALFYDGINSAC